MGLEKNGEEKEMGSILVLEIWGGERVGVKNIICLTEGR